MAARAPTLLDATNVRYIEKEVAPVQPITKDEKYGNMGTIRKHEKVTNKMTIEVRMMKGGMGKEERDQFLQATIGKRHRPYRQKKGKS